jgi:CheY-like chemotaxis protein
MSVPLKRLVFLLADDDDSDLILLRRIFKRLKYVEQLVVVPDGEHAIACLRGDDKYSDRVTWPFPDVLALDERMPRLSGSEVLRGLRSTRQFAHLPVVILSGALLPSQTEVITRLNAAYCPKTPDPDQMAMGIDAAVRTAFSLAREELAKPRVDLNLLKVTTFPNLAEQPDCIRVWT